MFLGWHIFILQWNSFIPTFGPSHVMVEGEETVPISALPKPSIENLNFKFMYEHWRWREIGRKYSELSNIICSDIGTA